MDDPPPGPPDHHARLYSRFCRGVASRRTRRLPAAVLTGYAKKFWGIVKLRYNLCFSRPFFTHLALQTRGTSMLRNIHKGSPVISLLLINAIIFTGLVTDVNA